MEELNLFKASIAGALGALAAFLEWRGVLFVILFALMVIDYFSGWIAALKNGEWKSAVAKAGVAHKVGMILIVAVAGIADIAIAVICDNIAGFEFEWCNALLPLVMAWYILTELGSIVENAVLLGAPVPAWLAKMFEVGQALIDKLANKNDEEESE